MSPSLKNLIVEAITENLVVKFKRGSTGLIQIEVEDHNLEVCVARQIDSKSLKQAQYDVVAKYLDSAILEMQKHRREMSPK